MCTALQQLGLHYGVCTQRSRGSRGLQCGGQRWKNAKIIAGQCLCWGLVEWVWLKKKSNAGDMTAWILIWCKPHRCVQGMLYSPSSSAYTWRQARWCCIWLRSGFDLLTPYFASRYWGWIVRVHFIWGTKERHKDGDRQEAYCSQARSISNITLPGSTQADTVMDWICSFHNQRSACWDLDPVF